MQRNAYGHFPETVRYQIPPKPKNTAAKVGWFVLGIAGTLLVFGLGVVAGRELAPRTAAAPATTVTATATVTAGTAATVEPPKPAGLGAGIYRVGPGGIDPGRYVTDGSSRCYIARLQDDSGDTRSIKSNNNLAGPGSMTVQSGEFFEIRGTCRFRKA